MRKALLALALVLLALPAFARVVDLPAVVTDGDTRPIYQTFARIYGDSLQCKVDNDSLKWIAKNITGANGWFNFSFAVETYAKSARFKFKTADYGTTIGYTWSSAIKYDINALAVRDAFQIGLADSFKVAVCGTNHAPCYLVEMFYWYEAN